MIWVSLFVLLDAMLVAYFAYDTYYISIAAIVNDSEGRTFTVPNYLTFINDMKITRNRYSFIRVVKGDLIYELHLEMRGMDNIWRYQHIKGVFYVFIQLLINLIIYPMVILQILCFYVYPPSATIIQIYISGFHTLIHALVDLCIETIVFIITLLKVFFS
jgi:hypothetical protein